MPFKVTTYRLEMMADIFYILALIFGIIFCVAEIFLLGIVTIGGGFVFSYILYGIATILHNTEEILDKLNELTPEKDEHHDEIE